MSWGLACHQCDHRDGRTNHEGDVLPAYSYHDTEAEALEARWEHVEATGHGEVFVLPGCHFIGEGRPPRRLPDGDDVDRYRALDVRDPGTRMYPSSLGLASRWRGDD